MLFRAKGITNGKGPYGILSRLYTKISKQFIGRRWRIKGCGGRYMVTMLNPYHKLSQKDVENFEVKNNIELTNDYKVFLLKWNGGAPDPEVFMISEEEGPTVMNYFYSIGGPSTRAGPPPTRSTRSCGTRPPRRPSRAPRRVARPSPRSTTPPSPSPWRPWPPSSSPPTLSRPCTTPPAQQRTDERAEPHTHGGETWIAPRESWTRSCTGSRWSSSPCWSSSSSGRSSAARCWATPAPGPRRALG